jgi:hypothetical protein
VFLNTEQNCGIFLEHIVAFRPEADIQQPLLGNCRNRRGRNNGEIVGSGVSPAVRVEAI